MTRIPKEELGCTRAEPGYARLIPLQQIVCDTRQALDETGADADLGLATESAGGPVEVDMPPDDAGVGRCHAANDDCPTHRMSIGRRAMRRDNHPLWTVAGCDRYRRATAVACTR
jgi:hypothetical protein